MNELIKLLDPKLILEEYEVIDKQSNKSDSSKGYVKDDFIYNEEEDIYICPIKISNSITTSLNKA